MRVRKGYDRVVFIFPSIRLVVKIPVIHLFKAVKIFFRRDLKGRRLRYLSRSVYTYWSFRSLLLRGVAANLNEFLLYVKTRNVFLQPTLFSFLGFLNIQLYGEPCQLLYQDLWCQLYRLTEGKVFDDSHHFSDPENFSVVKGKLKMCDYGSPRCRGVIESYGLRIFESFDMSYCWEEEKKNKR